MQRQLMLSKTNLERNLKDEHPILSRVRPWLIARLANCEQQFTTEKAWSAHEEALRMCQEQRGLEQTTYFLNRDLTFMKEVRGNKCLCIKLLYFLPFLCFCLWLYLNNCFLDSKIK